MRAAEFITEDIELRHEPTSTDGVEVHAYRDGQEVGWVRFTRLKSGQVKAAMVHVPERLRRQGIGSAMYRYARDELGLDIVPSDSQTELGRAFWNKLHEGRKKRRRKNKYFGGYWYPGYRYYGGGYYGSGDGNAGDGGGGESVAEAVIGPDDPVDVYIRGQHQGETVTRLVARNFPNKNIPLLINRLETKYGVNPSAVVYGPSQIQNENFADGKVKGKSRPGRVKRAGASCAGSVSELRSRAKKYGGEKGKMYHWCANMKSGRQK